MPIDTPYRSGELVSPVGPIRIVPVKFVLMGLARLPFKTVPMIRKLILKNPAAVRHRVPILSKIKGPVFGLRRNDTELLQETEQVRATPMFHDLPISETNHI